MTTEKFEDMGLSNTILRAITESGFESPTDIQTRAIPSILDDRDILAQAKTGSGKTAAFVIPLLQKLLDSNGGKLPEAKPSHPLIVVLSPTRELAQQTYQVTMTFGKELGVLTTTIIGGETFEGQKKELNKGLHFLVATPGRLVDLFKQKLVNFSQCRAVALDEADRLFDMGFKDDIRFLLSKMPQDRQLLMFSATNNLDVLNTAYAFKSHPEEIKCDTGEFVVDAIDQMLYHVGDNEKVKLLVGILKQTDEPYGLVFCNTQSETHVLATWLQNLDLGLNVKAISGKLPQNKRTKLMSDFRDKKINLLISTDVAARGLDIENVNLVINYDLPQDASNYVHRIGRTGRAGKGGKAISFCAFEDTQYLPAIEEYIQSKIPVGQIEEDLLYDDIGPRPRVERKRSDKRDSRGGSRENRNKKTMDKRNQSQQRGRRQDRGDQGKKRPQRDNQQGRKQRQGNKRSHDKGKKKKPSNLPRNSVQITSKNFQKAQDQALKQLNIDSPDLLKHEVVSKGRPAFFLFGPLEVKYNFYINPNYEIHARKWLDKLIQILKLDLSHAMTAEQNKLIIDFVGEDEKLLMDDKFELLRSIEHLLRKHLGKAARVGRDFRLELKVSGKTYGNPKDARIEKMARQMADKAINNGEPIVLNSMSPKDRRIVHQCLNENPKVTTSSLGDGRFKKIKIDPVQD